MEDLLQPETSKQRSMVISSSGEEHPFGASCVSRSCPDVSYHHQMPSPIHGSLPDHLETARVFGVDPIHSNVLGQCISGTTSKFPCTPPPSPQSQARTRPEKNLVLISSLIVDPSAPNFSTYYNSVSFSYYKLR